MYNRSGARCGSGVVMDCLVTCAASFLVLALVVNLTICICKWKGFDYAAYIRPGDDVSALLFLLCFLV